jgi:transposase
MRTRKAYPDWVEKHRGEGKEIKMIGGRYYLTSYEYRTVDGRRKKVSTGTLGTIRPEGLIPSCKKGQTIRSQVTAPLEYGASFLLESLGNDILSNLNETFSPQLSGQIFEMAKIGLVSPSPFKRMDLIYSNSYDSRLRPNLPLSPSTITSVLNEIGSNREAQLNFMRKYYDGTEFIIFDGTRLVSHSLGEKGYNHCNIDDPQMNLQYCFSLRPEKKPIYFKGFTGNKTDISILKTCIQESGLNNMIFIADKGYYSGNNAEELTKNGISYIMPIKRCDKRIDYASIDMSSMDGFDGFFSFHSRPIFYKTIQRASAAGAKGTDAKGKTEEPKPGETIVLYFDQKMRGKEIMDSTCGKDGGIDDLKERKFRSMGTIALATTIKEEKTPKEIYEIYKERELIEDANDAYKNVMRKNASYLQNTNSYYGWLFINHITLLLYYRVYNKIKEKGMTSKYSVADVIEQTKRITIQEIAKEHIIEIGTKVEYDRLADIFGDSIPTH